MRLASFVTTLANSSGLNHPMQLAQTRGQISRIHCVRHMSNVNSVALGFAIGLDVDDDALPAGVEEVFGIGRAVTVRIARANSVGGNFHVPLPGLEVPGTVRWIVRNDSGGSGRIGVEIYYEVVEMSPILVASIIARYRSAGPE